MTTARNTHIDCTVFCSAPANHRNQNRKLRKQNRPMINNYLRKQKTATVNKLG